VPLPSVGAVRVRLTRKLADSIDGIDLENRQVGDVFEVSASEGRLLIAERWAVLWDATPAEPEES
jgi:hypothetical protein